MRCSTSTYFTVSSIIFNVLAGEFPSLSSTVLGYIIVCIGCTVLGINKYLSVPASYEKQILGLSQRETSLHMGYTRLHVTVSIYVILAASA